MILNESKSNNRGNGSHTKSNKMYERKATRGNRSYVNEGLTEKEKTNLKNFLRHSDEEAVNNIANEISADCQWIPMQYFDETMEIFNIGTYEAIEKALNGGFNPDDKYFKLFDTDPDVQKNDNVVLMSSNYMEFSFDDITELIEIIEKTPNNYLPREIQNILNK